MEAPPLDVRTFRDLGDELRRRARQLVPEWDLHRPDDPGAALAAIYAHFLELLLDRLNRVPAKNLLAFLDRFGVSRLPGAPARVPLTFTLAPGAASGFVPAGTQAATVQTETQPAVVFETEEDLSLIPARLTAGLVVEPGRDRYADISPTLSGQDDLVLAPFEGDRPIDHVLYVDLGSLAEMSRPGRLSLDLFLRSILTEPDWSDSVAILRAVQWETFRNGAWRAIDEPAILGRGDAVLSRFDAFPGSDEFELAGPGLPTPVRGRWLRGRLTQPLTALPGARALEVEAVRAELGAPLPTGQPIPPDRVLVNGVAVDFTREFRPLTDAPRVGTTFHLSSREAFSKVRPPGETPGRVMVHVEVAAADVQLVWEALRTETGSATWKAVDVIDETATFTVDGTVRLPMDVASHVDVQIGSDTLPRVRLFRVRITGGGYYHRVPCLSLFRISPLEGGRKRPTLGFTSDVPQEVDGEDGTAVLTGLTRLDLTAPFFPFGVNPEVGDTFYFGFTAGYETGTAAPGDPVQLVQQTTRLGWDYLGKSGWKPLGQSSTTQAIVGDSPHGFSDTTLALTQTGEVSFQRPADFAEGEVAELRGFWIRARVIGGFYGRPSEFVAINATDPRQGFKLRPATGAPNAPVVRSIGLSYTAFKLSPRLVTQTLATFTDHEKNSGPVRLFQPIAEQQPTFHLGFDRPFAGKPASLYFAAPPGQFVERLSPASATPGEADPRLDWEYWDGRQWAALPAVDDTRGLTRSGFVQFLGPDDIAFLDLLGGGPACWVRARRTVSADGPRPRLTGVWPNAVVATQAVTVRDEVLGSSNGRKIQTVRLARSPVLPGFAILVREPECPPGEEVDRIRAEEGPDAVQARDNGRSWWVRWHEVPTLAGSGPRSRHYTLDHVDGTVRFGDGVHGMIPPEGRDSIVCAAYRSGGGSAGNLAVGAINRLKTSIPYVNSVSNPVPADGGADPEPLDATLVRGPQVFRHRGRAVTAEDFEWLTRQSAGTRVARSCCLSGRNRESLPQPGWVTVVVVPRGNSGKPVPSAGLVSLVAEDLATRCSPVVALQEPPRLNVIGPGYVPVELAVEFRPVSLARAEPARNAVLDALRRFLDPLNGGPDGTGWEFGRDVYLSELFAAFENLRDVEHVRELTFKPTVAVLPLRFTPPPNMIILPGFPDAGLARPQESYPVGSLISEKLGPVAAVVAEPIPAHQPLAGVTVVLFQEGERIRIGGDDGVEVAIRAISGTTLTIDPFRAQADFPDGTPVAGLSNAGRSALARAVARGERVSEIVVRNFRAGEPVRLTLPDGSRGLELTLGALNLGNRLRVPPFCLAYSGSHTVTAVAD